MRGGPWLQAGGRRPRHPILSCRRESKRPEAQGCCRYLPGGGRGVRSGEVLGPGREPTREGSSHAVAVVGKQSWDSDTPDFSQAACSDPEPLPPRCAQVFPLAPLSKQKCHVCPAPVQESGMPQAPM